MPGADRIAKKRERRIIQRSREREEIFICDYVKHKWPAMYGEAAHVYQELTKKYPNKTDLRKTPEHKAWKITNAYSTYITGQSVTIPPYTQATLYFPQQNTETSTIPQHPPDTETSTIPQHPPNTEPLPIPQHPPNTEPLPTPEHPPNTEPSTIPTPEPQASPEPPTPSKPMYTDNMQLIIPLLKPPVKHPGLITQTLEIITEETLQGDQQHTNIDQIDPQIVEQLIAELRADPDLKDIFTDIEQQFQQEQEQGMDIDIDIGMDTRLEDELENWELW